MTFDESIAQPIGETFRDSLRDANRWHRRPTPDGHKQEDASAAQFNLNRGQEMKKHELCCC